MNPLGFAGLGRTNQRVSFPPDCFTRSARPALAAGAHARPAARRSTRLAPPNLVPLRASHTRTHSGWEYARNLLLHTRGMGGFTPRPHSPATCLSRDCHCMHAPHPGPPIVALALLRQAPAPKRTPLLCPPQPGPGPPRWTDPRLAARLSSNPEPESRWRVAREGRLLACACCTGEV